MAICCSRYVCPFCDRQLYAVETPVTGEGYVTTTPTPFLCAACQQPMGQSFDDCPAVLEVGA